MALPANPPHITLADAVAEAGASVAFGLPGGGPNLDVIDALTNNDVRFVLAHAETSACIMASVYGLLVGRPAVAVVTRGPGAASAVNGAAQATLDRHPLILVTDTVPVGSADRVAHQQLDQLAMFDPAVKAGATVGAASDTQGLVDLIQFANAPRRGAVHLDYDASATGVGRRTPATVAPRSSAPATDLVGQLDGVARRIARASRPVVILGLDAVDHAARLRPVLERFGAPVLTTYQAIGTIDTEHRCAGGLFTNGASERPLLDQADLIIAIGLDSVELIPAPWTIVAPVLSLATVAADDKYLPITTEVVGDLGELATIALGGRDHGWAPTAGSTHRESVRRSINGHDLGDRRSGPALSPTELVEAAIARTPRDATITVDAGAHFLAIMPLWPVADARRLLISNGLATMGYAVPAAIGAAIARPGSPVLCLVGDGGLGMTLAEIETISRLNLPITIVVFNDSALSLIEIKQRPTHGGRAATAYQETDFAAVAAANAMTGLTVTSVDEFVAALDGGWRSPRLIDVRIDPSPYRRLLDVTRG